MNTVATAILSRAEAQIGVHEDPMGSNEGGCEKYQVLYGSWMIGEPWCGAFVGWTWATVDESFKSLASPSTAIMCDIARDKKLIVPPQPGAAFVICGVHTGLLHSYLGNGVWRTIEGNSGDAVNWRQRYIDNDIVVYGPPGLHKKYDPLAVGDETWYFLEDPSVTEFYGGWATYDMRKDAQLKLEGKLGKRLRIFRDPSRPKTPYMLEDVSVTQFYGGWRDKDSRKKAKQRLEKRLGRSLREFSETRPGKKSNAKGDSLGKVD